MNLLILNSGLPMIIVQLPAMIIALVPIVVLETLLIRRWLTLTYRDAFRGVGKANLATTLLGIPLAWSIMLVIGIVAALPLGALVHFGYIGFDSPLELVLGVLVSSSWLVPTVEQAYWMIPAASVVLLVPSYFVSVRLETSVCLRIWTESNSAEVRHAVLRANLASYSVLLVFACGLLAYQVLVNS